MVVFPPAAAVTVAVDGRRIAAYVGAELAAGRVYAPLSLLRTLVDRLWIEDGAVYVESGGHRARVPLTVRFSKETDAGGIEVAPVLRALGDSVHYFGPTHTLEIRTPAPQPVASALPVQTESVVPREIFTPEPRATVRPVWSGAPLPRRTPLPAPPRAPNATALKRDLGRGRNECRRPAARGSWRVPLRAS